MPPNPMMTIGNEYTSIATLRGRLYLKTPGGAAYQCPPLFSIGLSRRSPLQNRVVGLCHCLRACRNTSTRLSDGVAGAGGLSAVASDC